MSERKPPPITLHKEILRHAKQNLKLIRRLGIEVKIIQFVEKISKTHKLKKFLEKIYE